MKPLEQSFLNAFFVLDWFIQKVNQKFLESQQTESDFRSYHISYITLYHIYYHCAILQARKLYEGEIRYALSDDEWRDISNFRHDIAHAYNLENRKVKVAADVNERVNSLLSKIATAIDTKYNLSENPRFQEYTKSFYDDLNTLGN